LFVFAVPLFLHHLVIPEDGERRIGFQESVVMKRILISLIAVFGLAAWLPPVTAMAQQALVIKPLAEMNVAQLPAGPLYWRLENYLTLEGARGAAGPTGLAVQSGGKFWLVTLGTAGGASPGGIKVAEVGPLPAVVATHYLLRVNEASGPAGSITRVHTHPGSEAFYVLAGETTSETPDGKMRVGAGHGQTGHPADTPMRVSSSGSSDLISLVMFVVDADRPFASPAVFP
jgi:quercetin dioxygenase-like cupin family protein